MIRQDSFPYRLCLAWLMVAALVLGLLWAVQFERHRIQDIAHPVTTSKQPAAGALVHNELARYGLFGRVVQEIQALPPIGHSFILDGVVAIPQNPQAKTAIALLHRASEPPKTYHVGDRLDNGSLVTGIRPRYVTIDKGSYVERFLLENLTPGSHHR